MYAELVIRILSFKKFAQFPLVVLSNWLIQACYAQGCTWRGSIFNNSCQLVSKGNQISKCRYVGYCDNNTRILLRRLVYGDFRILENFT